MAAAGAEASVFLVRSAGSEEHDASSCIALKALLAPGLGRHKEWRDRSGGPPNAVLYGAKKLAKAKSGLQFLTFIYDSYNNGPLRGLPAFPLYASFIRDQNGAADTACGPSGCSHPDGPGSTANGVEELASAQTAGTAQTSKVP